MGFLLFIAIVTLHFGSLEAGNLKSRACEHIAKPLTRYGQIADDHLRGLKVVTDSATDFGSRFSKHFQNSLQGDKVYSVISLWTVLSLLYFGARGRTEATMHNVLKISQHDSITKGGYQDLIDALVSDGKTLDLSLATKIFLRSGVHPTAEYTSISTTSFRSEVETIDVSDPKAASKQINDWCALKTNNCIHGLIQPEAINSNTVMVLVNAVYFKGTWLHEFDPQCTKKSNFFSAGTIKSVPMMYQSTDINYGKMHNENFKYAIFPFKTEHENLTVSMIAMLPDEINGLPALQKKLVKITSERLLRRSNLHEMGFEEIFGNADFRKISAGVSVSNVIQKAGITVDEKGAGAAAATGIICSDSISSRNTSKYFNADHPFAFRIVATFHGYPVDLFAGQYTGQNVVDN